MARLERKPAEMVAAAGFIVQLICAVLAYAFTRLTGAGVMWVLTWQAAIGIGIWLLTWTVVRQSRLADEEREDWERLQAERAAGGAQSKLFEEDEIQAFSARNRLRFMEKYLMPIASVLMVLLLAGIIAVALVFRVVIDLKLDLANGLLITAILAGMCFVEFLISMYASGMSRQAEWRALRAAASYMMLTALFAAVAATALILATYQVALVDTVASFAMMGVMAIVTVEVVVNFVLDFYRPRVEGVEQRPAYDSRLLGLLAQPGGIFKTVAATLDYQFGFRVSQTWFYKFIEHAVVPLLLFQMATYYLLTCFVIVGASQQGILTRFGKFQRVVEPGLVVKCPWPIDRVERINVGKVQTITLGHSSNIVTPTGLRAAEAKPDPKRHVFDAREKGMLVALKKERQAGEWNIIVALGEVQYRIIADKVDGRQYGVEKWYRSSGNPEALLTSLCRSEQVKYFASHDLFDILNAGQDVAAKELKANMQKAADNAGLGVRILSVGFGEIRPVTYEGLLESWRMKAQVVQQSETMKHQAWTDADKSKLEAQTNADRKMREAREDYVRQTVFEEARANRSRKQSEFFQDPAKRRVFMTRELMSALEESLADVRKYVILVPGYDLNLRLNLEEVGSLGVGDIPKFEETRQAEEEKAAQENKAQK